jgi:SanA protein
MFFRSLRILAWSGLFFLLFGVFCYYFVELSADEYLSYNAYALPKCNTAIVLGTSKRLASGTDNLYFFNRMSAAEKLFRTNKIKQLILSGDNRKENYNEPKEMKKVLLAKGLPESSLIADYAGLRTFDSMVRSKEVFGQDTLIVVSQKFQNARAVFIGRRIGLTVYGYNADKVTNQQSYRIKLREFFSRIKCVLDLYVLGTKPKHLGDRIFID